MIVWTFAVACSAVTFPAVGISPITSRFGSFSANAAANAVSIPGSATMMIFRAMLVHPGRQCACTFLKWSTIFSLATCQPQSSQEVTVG